MDNQYTFMEKAAIYVQELPRPIRAEFYNFKRREEAAVLWVSDNPVLLEGAGPRPSKHIEIESDYRLNDAKILHGLYGYLLGEGVGFTSQRDGSLYNNIYRWKVTAPSLTQAGGRIWTSAFTLKMRSTPPEPNILALCV